MRVRELLLHLPKIGILIGTNIEIPKSETIDGAGTLITYTKNWHLKSYQYRDSIILVLPAYTLVFNIVVGPAQLVS